MASVILLLFVYVFGGTLGAGLIAGGTRSDYLAYITPAIVLMGAVGIMQMIAVWVAMDMSEGIVARFRTMAIARSSVLAGHAYSGIVLVIVSTVPLLGFAVLLGYRPHADGMQWLALAGLIAADRHRAVLARRRVRARHPPGGERQQPALDRPHPADGEQRFRPRGLLPRAGCKDSPSYQPFTPIINTIRGLLAGNPAASDAVWAIGWLLAIAVVGYVWSAVAVPAPHHRPMSPRNRQLPRRVGSIDDCAPPVRRCVRRDRDRRLDRLEGRGVPAYYIESWQFDDGETVLWRDDAADVVIIPKLGQAVSMTPARLHRWPVSRDELARHHRQQDSDRQGDGEVRALPEPGTRRPEPASRRRAALTRILDGRDRPGGRT